MSSLHTLIKTLTHEPTDGLEERLTLRLVQVVGQTLKRRLWLVRLGTVGAVFIAGGVLLWVTPQLVQSEFWSLLSLLFSDGGIVAGALGDFSYSLLETLPVVPLAFVLFAFLVLSYSLSVWLTLIEETSQVRWNNSLNTY